MSRSNDLLDFLYHQNYYNLIGICLSRQINTSIPQKINLIGKLEQDNGATIFLLGGKQKHNILHFSLESINVIG